LPKYSPSWDSGELSLYDPLNLVGWKHLKTYLIKNYQYKEGCTLFDVPYDWRKNINKSAETYLKKWIDHAKKIAGTDKVHIIAHSMGGLLARAYIQNIKSDNDIDIARLAMVGTPNHGAALAYYLWEGGDPDTADKNSNYISHLTHFYLMTTSKMYYTFHNEFVAFPIPKYKTSKAFLINPVYSIDLDLTLLPDSDKKIWTLIHNQAPSIRQLLPVYDFALSHDGEENNISKCQNDFLLALNNDPNILRMVSYSEDQSSYDNNKVITKLFAGKNKQTIKTINVGNPPEESSFYSPNIIKEACYKKEPQIKENFLYLYPDGVPDLSPVKTDAGDATVLLESVNINYSNGDNNLSLTPEVAEGSHSSLINEFKKEIAMFITQDNEWNLSKRQKSSISDTEQITALSLGVIGRVQPYIENSSSLGTGIHYLNKSREDNIPESSVEISTDSGNIIIESPEAGLYTVHIRGIYHEDYFLFLTYHTEEFTETLSYHAYNHAETTHFTFYLDSNSLTVNHSVPVTITVTSEAIESSGKTRLSWNVSENENVVSYNVYNKKRGQLYYAKLANVNETFLSTDDHWAENDETEVIRYAVSALDHEGNESFLSPLVSNKCSSSNPPQTDLQENLSVQITFTGDLASPVWSPDDKILGFKKGNNVWTMNIDGTNAVQISTMPSYRRAWGPTFQPGSELLYYMDNSPTGADWWWFIKTSYDGSLGRNEVTKLVPGGHGNSPPRFSSDGNKIAFIHIAYMQNNIKHMYIKYRNADGSNERTVLSDDNICWKEVYWGKGISSDKLFYNKKEDDVISIFMISPDGTGETKITDKKTGDCILSDTSPDGNKVLFIKDHQVCSINIDGTNLTQLTDDIYTNSSPAYSPDGTKTMVMKMGLLLDMKFNLESGIIVKKRKSKRYQLYLWI